MAKSDNIKYEGFNFSLALQPTGKQPLDSRTIVTSLPQYPSDFEAGAAYEGMLVTLLGENGKHKIYLLENTLQEILDNVPLRWREAGGGSTIVSSYEDLKAFANEDNIGKTVYLNTEVVNGSETYTAGLYVVTGVNSVSKLAASSLGEPDLGSLSTEISTIKTTISGLDASYTAGDGQFIKSIEQTDGKISSVTYAGISAGIGAAEAHAYLTSYTYLEGSVIDNRASIQVTTNGGKVTGVNLEKFGNLVTKEYVDHMHNVLLGDGHLAETLDTIKEISYWLDKNPSDAAKLTLSLVELTQKVENDGKTVASAINAINDKFSSYATIAYVEQEINNVYSYVKSRLSWDVI